ncbi:MAG: ROK family transcriptional regulator [Bacilli bacterium]
MDFKAGNQQLIRDINIHKILNELRKNDEMARIELAKKLKLGKSTVSGLVNLLIGSGCVQENGPKQTALGRKPTSLRLNADWQHVLALHLDTDVIHVGVVNLKCEVIQHRKFQYSLAGSTWEETLQSLEDLTRKVCDEAGLNWEQDILGVSLAMPGVIDVGTGVSVSRLQRWTEFPVRNWLSERFGKKVVVENDANALVLAEKMQSVGASQDDMAAVLVGEGIGVGIVSNGAMVRGVARGAGQLGHMKVETHGPKCHCGQVGCLETFISRQALKRMYHERIADAAKISADTGEEIDERTIVAAARSGVREAEAVLRMFSTYLGRALSTIVNLLNPAQIVLAGPMFEEDSDFVVDAIWEVVRANVAPVLSARLTIRTIGDGDEAFLIGTASLILEEAFAVPVFKAKGPHSISISEFIVL